MHGAARRLLEALRQAPADQLVERLAQVVDLVGLGERDLDVAQLVLELAGDVGRLALELDVVVQDRRAGLHRFEHVEDRRQLFVFDVD